MNRYPLYPSRMCLSSIILRLLLHLIMIFSIQIDNINSVILSNYKTGHLPRDVRQFRTLPYEDCGDEDYSIVGMIDRYVPFASLGLHYDEIHFNDSHDF